MSLLKHKRSVDDIWPMYNKAVLVRVDFNVPVRNGIILKGKDQRIVAALPTIRRVIDHGGKAILMSHMGRPTGHKFSALKDDQENKLKYLKIWADERGKGLTTFFSLCRGEDKQKILSWSSVADIAETLSHEKGAGKTDLFESLTNEEKIMLLNRFQADKAGCERHANFPQLRQYNGFEDELTLRPVADRLAELLNSGLPDSSKRVVVKFAEDCLNAGDIVDSLAPGEVLLLENVRFYSDENSQDEMERLSMANIISSYGDFFVSDAFGTSHRMSATIVGIPSVLGHGCCGYLMRHEIDAYTNILGSALRPVVVIIGGAKVSDKIILLEHILPQIDSLIIGGAIAYTFLKAKGFRIANSFHESGQSFTDKYGELRNIDESAKHLLEKAHVCKVNVLLPVDHICHTSCDATDSPFITGNEHIPDGYMALDIGPKTIELYKNCITSSKTAIWNGPMGVFEIPTYSTGSFVVAKAMGDGTEERGLLSIIAGGASVISAELSGHVKRVSHVSSDGGASLELLAGQDLPGISVLDDR